MFVRLPLCIFFLAALLRQGCSFGVVYPTLGTEADGDEKTPLYVGLIQSYDPMHRDDEFSSVGTVVGTELALDHINAADSVLPGYRLHYNFINSPCNGYQATDAVLKQVWNAPTKVGIIGAGCSDSTVNAALLSQFYNLTQISCISTSPTLAQRDVYRHYIQLLPPEFETARGFYSIISHYGWKKVGVLVQEGDIFEKTFIVLKDKLRMDGVAVQSYMLNFYDLQRDGFNFDINFNDVRIFIIMSYQSLAVTVLCEAYKRNQYYPQYFFLLFGWYSHEWWKDQIPQSNCGVDEMQQVLQHALAVDALPDAQLLGEYWEAHDLGITNGEFYRAEKEHVSDPQPPIYLNATNFLSQYCYDATWAFALTLNKTISDLENNDTLNEMAKAASDVRLMNASQRFRIEHFDYNNHVIVEEMMRNWESLSFVGVTGNVSFTNGLRELNYIRVTQYLEDDEAEFDEIHVGYLNKQNNFSISAIEENIMWKYGIPHEASVDKGTLGAVYPALQSDSGTTINDERKPLYVGLIQSIQDDQLNAFGTVVGTELALDGINADDTLLPGYRLHYNFINSPCDEYQAADAAYKLVLNAPIKIGIIGAGCSFSTQNAAFVSQFFNLSQISCIATSPTLAKKELYRRYIQLLPTESASAEGFYSIISGYGWRRVGVILQEGDLFEQTFITLERRLTSDGVDVQSYKVNFYDIQTNTKDVFDFDNFNGFRIFIIISYESFALPMLCEAYRRGLYYPEYHFLLMGWYSQNWWMSSTTELSCSSDEFEQVLQHSLTVNILPDIDLLGEHWEATDLGITNADFHRAEKEHISDPKPPLYLNVTNFFSQYCYDATWAFAFALNKTISDLENNDTFNDMAMAASGLRPRDTSQRFHIEHFDYSNSVILEQMMLNWESVSFVGVTGDVSFENGLRELLHIRITQYLKDDGVEFHEKHVGDLEKYNNFELSFIEENIIWKYGVPYDGTEDEMVEHIHDGVTAIFTLLGIVGIIFAVVCLLLNFWFRNKVVIKLSSPTLNYLIGAGAILLYINIILVVIPLEEERSTLSTSLCCITPWFTAIGYSLCYGTILVKMFRTWYIFNNPLANKRKIHDWMLITIVMFLVVLDVAITATYTGLEASRGGADKVINREQEKTTSGHQEAVTLHYVYVCNSIERQATLGILYGYKAFLQIFALLLSFATFNVRIHGLDDSKPIIIATYISSLVLAVVIVSTYTLTEYINAFAVVFDVGFFLGTTVILCLVFMTKMYSLVKDPDGTMVFPSTSAGGDGRGYNMSSSHKMGSQAQGESSLKQVTSGGEPIPENQAKGTMNDQ